MAILVTRCLVVFLPKRRGCSLTIWIWSPLRVGNVLEQAFYRGGGVNVFLAVLHRFQSTFLLAFFWLVVVIVLTRVIPAVAPK